MTYMACEHCDTLYQEPTLKRAEVAVCRRCGSVLLRGGVPNADTTFALAITALIVYGFANVYPVISVEIQGQHNEATVWQAVMAMADGYFIPVAIFVGMSMIIVPLLQIVLLGWVTGHARLGRRAPGFTTAMRILDYARPWSMVEVFLIGALVSIVKLSGLMEVQPGVGLFSLLGLTILVPLLAGRSTRGLWTQAFPDADASPSADTLGAGTLGTRATDAGQQS
jgi:paraquat-inducible protein A